MNRADRLAWPYLLGLTLLVALPAAAAFALAFTEYTGLNPPELTGLDNFRRMLGEAAFWRSIWNSLIYIAISVPLRIFAVVGLALLLHSHFRGSSASRVSAYLPTVVPDVAYSLLWLWLLNPLYGPLAGIFHSLGLTSPSWLTDPTSARFAVAIMGVFQIGEGLVIALAARRVLPQHLFEAATVDGAGAWFTFKKITLPLMAPVLLLLTLRDVILALQLNFVPALLLTDGGPRQATMFLPLYVYRQAFRYFRLGYASAVSLTMFVVTALAIYAFYRTAKRWRLL
ncbi:MAG: carbohydrate ABC transporter permease [Actinomycetota bacterium]